METIIESLNHVLVPLAIASVVPVFVLAALILAIALIVKKGKSRKPWLILVIPVLAYIVLGLVWVVANILYGSAL